MSAPHAQRTRESAAARRARAARIARRLAAAYPDARTALSFQTPFQLLVATILSAQCTDKKVNEVTRELFRRHGTPAALAAADPAALEAVVRPTGFYRQKARAIRSAAADLVERFGGEVPPELDALVTLRGVARKTANVVLGSAFGQPALAVDTHMIRVNQRLGLVRESDPEAIERELQALLPPAQWTAWTLRVIQHGRAVCTARAPRCEACALAPDCPFPAAQRAPARARRPERRPAARRARSAR